MPSGFFRLQNSLRERFRRAGRDVKLAGKFIFKDRARRLSEEESNRMFGRRSTKRTMNELIIEEKMRKRFGRK